MINNSDSYGLREIDIPAILLETGIERQDPDFMVFDSGQHELGMINSKPFRSKHFALIIVINGVLDLKVNLYQYHLGISEVIVIPPTAIREMKWEKKHCRYLALLFTPVFLSHSSILGKYLDISSFVMEGPLPFAKLGEFDYQMLTGFAMTISRLTNSHSPNAVDSEIVRNLFKSVLIKIKQYFDALEKKTDVSSTVLYRFLTLLSKHHLTEREVGFYSDKLNLHPKYLSQLLKKKTGKTAREFITEIIVLEAKILLDDRSFSVKQIANLLKFENPFHFSRFFKQYTGISPLHYRKGL